MKHVLIFFLLLAHITYGQSDRTSDEETEKISEQLLPSGDDDLNYSELFERLGQLTSNKININRASAETLKGLQLLTDRQIDEIMSHIKISGDLISIYELQTLPSFDSQSIHRLMPFVTVAPSKPGKSFWNRVIDENDNYVLLRYERQLETKLGFSTEDSLRKFKGDAGRSYLRASLRNAGDYSFGFTADNDAGESFKVNKNQFLFDHTAAHAQLMNKGKLSNLILGDFTSQFGQGLVLGGGFGLGKNSETVTTLRRSSNGFAPYTSANEAGFFRGLALTSKPWNTVNVSVFASSLRRDANSDSTVVSSLLTSGLHRNSAEMEKRKVVREDNAGVAIEWSRNNIQCGALVHAMKFNQPLHRKEQPYNMFDFSGREVINSSAWINIGFDNFSLFGEAAQTLNHGRGFVAGALASVGKYIDVSVLVRHYDKDFQAPYANAISESSTPKNERGIYWGWKHQLTRKLGYSVYVDRFDFPWLRYRNYKPSWGNEYLMRVTYRPSKQAELFVQARSESKWIHPSIVQTIYNPILSTRSTLIVNAACRDGALSYKTRVQYNIVRSTNSGRGIALIQDLGYDFGKISFIGRYAIFRTSNYDSRIYAYERDAWLSFTFPAYAGVGSRTYLMVRYTIGQHVDLWLRWAQTRRLDVGKMGSGTDTIDGPAENDFKMQLKVTI